MKFCMKKGDTNFIGIANVHKYKSFVDSDWELEMLMDHFKIESEKGHILVFQMSNEGIEHSWNVKIIKGKHDVIGDFYRKEVGYIKVTDNQLYLVDYDCLTMAAQFEDSVVPDSNCSKYKFDIDNGFYKVEIIQNYNVDKNEYVGSNNSDIIFNFVDTTLFQPEINQVYWCTYMNEVK